MVSDRFFPRLVGIALQSLVTPVVATGFAFLSWALCSNGGLWLALPVLWLVVFFVLGLEAHGLFYLCALPVPDSYETRPAPVRLAQAFWFLQVPFSWFNGISPPHSIAATQAAVFAFSVAFMIAARGRARIRQ